MARATGGSDKSHEKTRNEKGTHVIACHSFEDGATFTPANRGIAARSAARRVIGWRDREVKTERTTTCDTTSVGRSKQNISEHIPAEIRLDIDE